MSESESGTSAREKVSSPRVQFQQMLVAREVGGAAKLAMQIHAHVVNRRGPVSRLLLPGGGEAERTAQRFAYPYLKYRADRIASASRWTSFSENLRLLLHRPRGVIHVHAPFLYGAARPFLRASGLKTVLHVHLDFTAEDLVWSFRSPPDTLITCADFMRHSAEQALEANGATRTRVVVLRNAVDLERFPARDRAEAKRKLGFPSSKRLATVIANLAPHKGQDTAIRAIAALKERHQHLDLWLAGGERTDGGGYLEKLQALARELNVEDRVSFLGFRNDIPDLLAASDFLLLPSTREGLPLVVLEAQAARTVVLAAPTAGVPEVVEDGRTGFLIEADAPRHYAEQLSRLLNEPSQADHIARAAHDHVTRHHALDSYCDRVLSEYDTLLHGT